MISTIIKRRAEERKLQLTRLLEHASVSARELQSSSVVPLHDGQYETVPFGHATETRQTLTIIYHARK